MTDKKETTTRETRQTRDQRTVDSQPVDKPSEHLEATQAGNQGKATEGENSELREINSNDLNPAFAPPADDGADEAKGDTKD